MKEFRLKKSLYLVLIFFLFSRSIFSQGLFINEVMSKNDTTISDSDGDFSDWLEIYNDDTNSVNLEGYSLSDNPDTPNRWKFGKIEIPGKGVLLVFASGKDKSPSEDNPHTNFKIKSAGEPLLLSSPSGVLIDSIFSGKIPPDYSRGRKPDGSQEWFFFKRPTPGTSNTSDGSKIIVTVPFPKIDKIAGFYPNQVEVNISTEFENGEVRFTLNGSDPDSTAQIYLNPLTFVKTTILRAAVFDTISMQQSKTTTRTYFINDLKDHDLPIFSISTDPDNLWGENGIYEEIQWVGESVVDIEVPINIEMFETDGKLAFNHRAGAEIFGSGSTGFPQKSLAILFRSKYDVGELNYKLFPEIPLMEFESFILRNSGNDWWSTMIRDAITYSLVKDNKNLDFQAYRPSVVYLNGEYWGIHNIREKVSEHFIEHHHFVPEEELDMLEYKEVPVPKIIHGDLEHYFELINFLENNDLSLAENYNQINSLIDINNFIDYQVMETFVGNIDWPANNNKFWRSRNGEGKWRWILYDTDTGYGLWDDWWADGTKGYYVNHILHATNTTEAGGNAWPNPAWSTFIFRKLLENEKFRDHFLNRYLDLLNTKLSSSNTTRVVEGLYNDIEPVLDRHLNKWKEDDGYGCPGPYCYDWELNKLKIFLKNRPESVLRHLSQYFEFSKEVAINIGVIPSNGGQVKLNSILIEEDDWDGKYFSEIPVKLVPLPKPGFTFSHWQGGSGSISEVMTVLPTKGMDIKAIFAPDSTTGSISINEINYSSFNVADPGDWFELYNSTSGKINLENWVISDGQDEQFYFPKNTQIESGGYHIICREANEFKSVFGSDTPLVSDLNFGLNAEGDSLILKNENGEIVDEVFYRIVDPWPVKTDDSGQTIELINSSLDNSLGENWYLSTGYGTPGKKNSQFQFIDNPTLALVDTLNESKLMVYPNPFLGSTRFQFFTSKDGKVEIKIYNILGQHITSVAKGNRASGVYEAVWNGYNNRGRQSSNGVYIGVLLLNSEILDTVKMVKF